ncbi:MAG: alpha/beta hydrolase [Actinomycetia bacterium]|nr:alpha/beta hydrolase [Actinomycetes bacterium]
MPTASTVASTDTVQVAAYDLGGDGRDVLAVHANGFCAGVFAPLARELRPWRCVAFDARGHGRSTVPDRDMAWEGHADDVLAVLDEYALDAPIGVGHSMGGAALLLAEQARPGSFAALWLFEPIVFPPHEAEPTENPLAAGALRRRPTFDSAGAAFANYASKPPLSELSDECLSAYVTHGFAPTGDGDSVTLRCRPETEADVYRMGIRHSAWAHLGEVNCEVLIARGAEIEPGPASIAPQVAERLPHGRLEEHPELGHFGPLAQPAGVAESIRRFAASI